MRHRRNTPTPARNRELRATAALPCVAAMLVAALTGAAPAPDSPAGGHGAAAAVSAHAGTAAAKSPDDQGTSRDGPAPAAPSRPDGGGALEYGATGDGTELFGTHDLYEPGPAAEYGSIPSSQQAPATAATGGVSPVLPLGAGLTLIGLGLALIALRLRHA